MTKYRLVLNYIILISSLIIDAILLVGLVYYLQDYQLNDEIKIYFQKGTIPFIILGMIIFSILAFFEIKIIKNKKK